MQHTEVYNTGYEIKLIITSVPHVSSVASTIFRPWTFSSSTAIFSLFLCSLSSPLCFLLFLYILYFYNICCTFFLALIPCLFTDNLLLWLGVGVETHSVPSAASGYLGVYGQAAFVPSTSMSRDRTSIIIKQRKEHVTLEMFFDPRVILRKNGCERLTFITSKHGLMFCYWII